MLPLPHNRAQAWLVLVALLLPTAFLAWRQSRLEIDRENRALRATSSIDAQALARRELEFGADRTALISAEGDVEGGELEAEAARALTALEASLRGSPFVRALRILPGSGVGMRDFVVELDARGARAADGAAPAVEELQRLLGQHAEQLRLRLTGLPVVETVIAKAAHVERLRMFPRLLLVLILLLAACYRSVGVASAVLLPALCGIAWTGGLFELLGRRLDPVSVLLDPVLLTVGVASGVQLAEAYLASRSAGLARFAAAGATARVTAAPAMLAALTTVVGCLSLATQAMPAVVDFGVFAAVGVALTFVLGLILTPTLLALFDARGRGARARAPQRWGANLARWIAERGAWIRLSAAGAALLGAASWPAIRIDNEPLGILPAEHPLRRDTQAIAERLGGIETFELYLPAGDRQADGGHLALLGAHLLEQPAVAGPAGVPLRSASGSAVISALLRPGGAAEREALFDALDGRLAALGSQGRAVGLSVQSARDSTRLVRGQLGGLAATASILWALFVWNLRSVRLATFAMAPNLLPCLVLYGSLAAAGRPFGVATAMISSVMLGLIVDSTIHFLHHHEAARRAGLQPLACVQAALARAGRGIVFTALVLALGFAVGASGSLETTVEFSLLSSATILLALASVLVVLPALLLAGPSAAVEVPVAQAV